MIQNVFWPTCSRPAICALCERYLSLVGTSGVFQLASLSGCRDSRRIEVCMIRLRGAARIGFPFAPPPPLQPVRLPRTLVSLFWYGPLSGVRAAPHSRESLWSTSAGQRVSPGCSHGHPLASLCQSGRFNARTPSRGPRTIRNTPRAADAGTSCRRRSCRRGRRVVESVVHGRAACERNAGVARRRARRAGGGSYAAMGRAGSRERRDRRHDALSRHRASGRSRGDRLHVVREELAAHARQYDLQVDAAWGTPSTRSAARSWACAPTISTSHHNARSRRSAQKRTA